jgi:hypothetical protein
MSVDLALECWRWIERNGKADRSTALSPRGLFKVGVHSTGHYDITQKRTFGGDAKSASNEHPT